MENKGKLAAGFDGVLRAEEGFASMLLSGRERGMERGEEAARKSPAQQEEDSEIQGICGDEAPIFHVPNHLIIHNSKSIGLPGIASQQLHAQSAGVVSVRQFCQMLSWPREADFEDALEQCRGGSQGRGALVCAEAQCPPRAHSEPAPGEFSTVQCMEWTLSVRSSPWSVLTVGEGGDFSSGFVFNSIPDSKSIE